MSVGLGAGGFVPPPSGGDEKTAVNQGRTLVDLVCAAAPRPEEAPRAQLAVGTAAGDYELVEEVGRGAFGTVYRAVHPVIGKEVAIKVLDRTSMRDDRLEQRFVTEARAVNRIKHPNIVDIFGFGELDSGHTFYVMELLSGETLAALLKRVGALPPRAALDVLEPLALALDAAHQAGVVHRDLKPANVFLHRTPDGSVALKLLDFGVAKMLDLHDPAVTVSGDAIGTPAYMAPEQWDGNSSTSASDIYALGVMAYQLLTGHRPFRASGVQELIKAQLLEPPRVASSLNPALPASVDAPLARMLAKQPAERPGRATEAVAALRRALSDPEFSANERRPPPAGVESPAAEGLPKATDTAPSAPRLAAAPSRSKALLFGVGLTLTVSALVWSVASTRRTPPALAKRSDSTKADLPVVPAASVQTVTSAPLATPATSSPPPSAERVSIVVKGAPAQAVLSVDGVPAGSVAEPLLVPRGTQAITLGISASGSPPQTHKIVPDRDRVISFTRRVGANSPVRKPLGAASELEF
jgi:eukaryotic-like serine/threonine-protein kinase